MFQHYFGIEFYHKNHTHVRGISQFKFTHCFGYIDNLTYCLSKPVNEVCLDAAAPTWSSAWLFDQVFDRLTLICNSNCEILGPRQYAKPTATIQSLVSGAIGSRFPSHQQWKEAYSRDKECKLLFALIQNPGKICKDSLKDVHYCYRQPLHNSHIVIEDHMLIYCKPICWSLSYTQLQIVPMDLQNILFMAFHTNQIGGHFNAYHTLHRLCLWYHWPEMIHISSKCAMPAPVVPLLTPPVKCPPSWSITSPLTCPSKLAFQLWGEWDIFNHVLWYDGICCHGASKARNLIHFCIGIDEDSALLWLVPYHCAQ